jgi:cyclic pyranopterin phosphate synthase
METPPPSRMVDVGDKPFTARRAVAEGWLRLTPVALAAFESASTASPSLLETARVAGIMAGKRTSDLLPLCHPITMDHLSVEFERRPEALAIRAVSATRAATGVEMEALTAVAMSALALLAALEEHAPGSAAAAALEGLRLVEKSGGRSGDFRAPDAPPRAPGQGSGPGLPGR